MYSDRLFVRHLEVGLQKTHLDKWFVEKVSVLGMYLARLSVPLRLVVTFQRMLSEGWFALEVASWPLSLFANDHVENECDLHETL